MLTLLLAASIPVLAKSVLIGLLAAANALLALIATVSVWKTYMLIGMKIFLTLLIFVPVVGIVIYLVWGQRKVRESQV
jgi:hypothetical protein